MENESFDHLSVFDGKSFDNAALIRGLTGNLTNQHPVLIKGSKQTMLVRFRSDAVLSGRGFKAIIDYKPQGLGTWSFCSTSNLCKVNEGNCGYDNNDKETYQADYECLGGLKCGHNNCPPQLELSSWVDCCYQPKWKRCQDSLDLEKGTIASSFYPNYYDTYHDCAWVISVPENYSVTLEFTYSPEFKTISVSLPYIHT